MNSNKLILVSGVALAVFAAPLATAQRTKASPPDFGAAPRANAMSSAPRSFHGRGSGVANFRGSGNWNRGSGNWNRGSGNWNRGTGRGQNWHRGGRGRWGHHRWHRHHRHHRRHFFPYYAYSPFGFGYGYPYWGASASLYYNGYDSHYAGARAGDSVVVNVQQELARAGYYHGAIDGVVGDGTRRAIRSYERANGLPVDGRIDADLLSAMGLS